MVINSINTRAKLNTGYTSTTVKILSFLISEIYPEEGTRILHRNVGWCSRIIPYHNTDDLASLPISAELEWEAQMRRRCSDDITDGTIHGLNPGRGNRLSSKSSRPAVGTTQFR